MTATQAARDRRHFTRVQFDAEAALVFGTATEEQRFASSLLDISLHGALLERPDDFTVAVGEPCNLEIVLGNGGARIKMQGKIVHLEEGTVGFVCKRLDVDSATHLYRLIELNLGDPKLMDREFSELFALAGE